MQHPAIMLKTSINRHIHASTEYMENNREAVHSHDDPLKFNDHDVIHPLRTTHQHQSRLLALADLKARILVGILAVILTIIFTNADFLADVGSNFLIPLVSFIVLEVAALVLALLVIMPKNHRASACSWYRKHAEPVLFGFFSLFSQDEYLGYLTRRINDSQSARHFLAKDHY